MNKFITFMAGSTIGALSALTGIYITAKIMNDHIETCDEDLKEEKEFFVNKINDYLKSHNIEKVDEYIQTIEDVCENFTNDYRKFLVSLYDYICKDDCTALINYIKSIQDILTSYSNAKWMDTKQAIENIINEETLHDNIENEPEVCAEVQ